jgi:hypothetical protein
MYSTAVGLVLRAVSQGQTESGRAANGRRFGGMRDRFVEWLRDIF